MEDDLQQLLTIDDGDTVTARVQHPSRADWIAGPVPLRFVNLEMDEHEVVFQGGPWDGWEARAGHGLARDSPNDGYLFGREPFAEWQDRPRELSSMTMTLELLSRAVTVWTGFGHNPWPDHSVDRMIQVFGDDTAMELIPRVRKLRGRADRC